MGVEGPLFAGQWSPFGFNCHQNQFSDSTDPCDALRKLTISKQKKEIEKLLTLIIKIRQ